MLEPRRGIIPAATAGQCNKRAQPQTCASLVRLLTCCLCLPLFVSVQSSLRFQANNITARAWGSMPSTRRRRGGDFFFFGFLSFLKLTGGDWNGSIAAEALMHLGNVRRPPGWLNSRLGRVGSVRDAASLLPCLVLPCIVVPCLCAARCAVRSL